MKEEPTHRVIFSLDENCVSGWESRARAAASTHWMTQQNNHDDSSDSMKQEWRRYGAARRKELIEKDEKEGGTRFELHRKCRVEHYFKIADRVLRDFRAKCDDPKAGLEETYVMGHRLLAFLGTGLPLHPDYGKASAAAFRAQAALDLEWIQDKMLDIALKIDEEQLNVFITMDFDPQPEDDSTISSTDADFTKFADFSTTDTEGWEDFTDWAFPSVVETDTSSSTNTSGDESNPGESSSSSCDPFDDPHIVFELEEDDSASEEEEGDSDQVNGKSLPQATVKFADDDIDEKDSRSVDHSYDVGTASSFLKRIANEDVRYETDSEAVDSWAQDGESGSRASSGTLPSYDPFRLAFREILNKAPKTVPSPTSPPNSPSDVENNEKPTPVDGTDRWAYVDFASIRRSRVNN